MTELVGLAIVMPAPCPRCRGTAATIGVGRGPHAAALMCICGRHCGWMSSTTFNFIRETVRHFGRPTAPICVTAARHQAESKNGADNQGTTP